MTWISNALEHHCHHFEAAVGRVVVDGSGHRAAVKSNTCQCVVETVTKYRNRLVNLTFFASGNMPRDL